MDKNNSITPNSVDGKLRFLGDWMLEKKARDIRLLDVSGLSSVFEGVALVTVNNVRQAQALTDNLLHKIKEDGLEYLGMEGYRSGDWILIDLNDIIVHIFLEDTRKFYNLDGFWSGARDIELDPE